MKIKGLKFKPGISLDLEANVYEILGKCRRKLRRLGVEKTEVTRFFDEATSSDHVHLIAVVEDTFDVIEEG